MTGIIMTDYRCLEFFCVHLFMLILILDSKGYHSKIGNYVNIKISTFYYIFNIVKY